VGVQGDCPPVVDVPPVPAAPPPPPPLQQDGERNSPLADLVAAVQRSTLRLATAGGAAHISPDVSRTAHGDQCERRFGLGLADEWREKKQQWCSPVDQGKSLGLPPASIHCFPYSHPHKQGGARGSKPELFCEGENIAIDFSKIRQAREVHDAPKSKPPRGKQYLDFDAGATLASCQRTKHWGKQAPFMPHMALQLGGKRFVAAGELPSSLPRTTIEETPTYLLARDEDCENMFHSSADHLNMFLVGLILGLDFHNLQVVLFDKHTDGPFYDLIGTAFSSSHPLKRPKDYQGVVVFRRLVWHLESPAGIVFPKTGGPTGLMRCHHSTLWHEYRAHILKAFNLWDVPPPAVPRVVITFRRRTAAKNVGRVIANEEDLLEVLNEGDLMSVEAADFGKLAFREQLKLVRGASVLVGAHGAGLMHVVFMAEEGVLVEIHPSYRLDRHFRLAARMAGKVYLPMRTTEPVQCKGSSDSIPVDKAEFRRTMDAALRIARSFDDGASECGLKCDPRILALDPGNDPEYKRLGATKAAPLITKFPCA